MNRWIKYFGQRRSNLCDMIGMYFVGKFTADGQYWLAVGAFVVGLVVSALMEMLYEVKGGNTNGSNKGL